MAGQTGVSDGEWGVYGGDPGHTRYSQLDQIDSSNAEELEIAWRWSGRNYGPNPRIRSATTPLMVNGVLYATAGQRRAVVAIDAGSGETLWMWTMDEGRRLAEAPRPNPGRGVGYWSDGNGDDRVIVVTPGYHMVALNAQTGRPISGFGNEGTVDLNEGHRARDNIPLVGTIGASSPPTVVGNVIVVGSAHHVGLRPPSMTNTPGDIRGFDARSGELLWTFKTIPEPGEEGNDTRCTNLGLSPVTQRHGLRSHLMRRQATYTCRQKRYRRLLRRTPAWEQPLLNQPRMPGFKDR